MNSLLSPEQQVCSNKIISFLNQFNNTNDFCVYGPINSGKSRTIVSCFPFLLDPIQFQKVYEERTLYKINQFNKIQTQLDLLTQVYESVRKDIYQTASALPTHRSRLIPPTLYFSLLNENRFTIDEKILPRILIIAKTDEKIEIWKKECLAYNLKTISIQNKRQLNIIEDVFQFQVIIVKQSLFQYYLSQVNYEFGYIMIISDFPSVTFPIKVDYIFHCQTHYNPIVYLNESHRFEIKSVLCYPKQRYTTLYTNSSFKTTVFLEKHILLDTLKNKKPPTSFKSYYKSLYMSDDICSICREETIKCPTILTCCYKVFCYSCIVDIKECPFCRNTTNERLTWDNCFNKRQSWLTIYYEQILKLKKVILFGPIPDDLKPFLKTFKHLSTLKRWKLSKKPKVLYISQDSDLKVGYDLSDAKHIFITEPNLQLNLLLRCFGTIEKNVNTEVHFYQSGV